MEEQLGHHVLKLSNATDVTPATNLVRALKGYGLPINKIFLNSAKEKDGKVPEYNKGEYWCCDILQKDILSYGSIDKIEETTISPFVNLSVWTEIFFDD